MEHFVSTSQTWPSCLLPIAAKKFGDLEQQWYTISYHAKHCLDDSSVVLYCPGYIYFAELLDTMLVPDCLLPKFGLHMGRLEACFSRALTSSRKLEQTSSEHDSLRVLRGRERKLYVCRGLDNRYYTSLSTVFFSQKKKKNPKPTQI